MIYLKLLFSFFKIGLFSFGGGYAMIPMIQKEIETHGWITQKEFVDIIAIAEMTPGPIAVNSATFVGYRAAGVLGSATATLGVASPSMIIILLIANYFFRARKNPLNVMVFYGVRPVVAGLIASAALSVARSSLFKMEATIKNFMANITSPLEFIDLRSIFIMILVLIAVLKLKVNPILALVGSGVLGFLMFYVFTF